MEVYNDDKAELTLEVPVQHYYIRLEETDKNRIVADLLYALDFSQVIIFVKSVPRAVELEKLLQELNFPSIAIHSKLKQEER